MSEKDTVSPYLKQPRRSLEEALRQRRDRLLQRRKADQLPEAENTNLPPDILPPVKSA